MKRTSISSFLLFIPLLCVCCTEEDRFLEADYSIENNNEAIENCMRQNRWIYTEMKLNYLWASELKDSLEYDYSLPPDQFFSSLKVAQDRFSYCYPNGNYRPETKGVDLNATVKLDSVYRVGDSKVGYFFYSGFETEADITDIILKMRGVDELIIDVRNNPGGKVATCLYLASLVAPKAARGKLFCSYEYNERIASINKRTTGSEYTFSYFMNDVITTGRALNLKRLFVLTGERSASASEMLINCLKPYMEVVTIGSKTLGKDVGMSGASNVHCQYVLMPITFRTYNASGESVPVTGIVPDILYQAESITGRIGSTQETLLGRALEEINKTNNTK